MAGLIIAVVIIVLILPIPFCIFSLVKGENVRKQIACVNGVIISIVLALCIVNAAQGIMHKELRDQYRYEKSSLLSSLTYEKTEDGYHLFEYHGFLGGTDFYAVPDSIKLPPFATVYHHVTLYYEKNTILNEYGSTREIGDLTYYVCPTVVKITTALFTLNCYVVFFVYGAFFIYNTVMFVYVLFTRPKNKKTDAAQDIITDTQQEILQSEKQTKNPFDSPIEPE